MELVTEIRQTDKKIFVLGYPGRDFELKAKSAEECEQWVAALNITKTKLLESKLSPQPQ